MSLLYDIQSAAVDEAADLGPILLKVRLLAARLGSQPLADWVRHESEGYPAESAVPDYRIIPVTYTATFNGPFGSGINNAPIPLVLIEKFAGEKWTHYEMRQSIAAVDHLLASVAKGNGGLSLDASNLILRLQGKLYPGYACNSVTGSVSAAALAELRHSVRGRILELTIELEKSVPEAASITMGQAPMQTTSKAEQVTQISQNIIYGNMTSISATAGAEVNVVIGTGDLAALVSFLEKKGIDGSDAKEFGALVASEAPESADEPFGPKAKKWILANLKKATVGTWKVGVAVATDLMKEAALRYYGLK
jgi:hypothetical protein